jgi:hypothetical protein
MYGSRLQQNASMYAGLVRLCDLLMMLIKNGGVLGQDGGVFMVVVHLSKDVCMYVCVFKQYAS